MTILQSLKSLSGYPLAKESLTSVAVEAGLDVDGEINTDIMRSAAYKRAKAGVYILLAEAPDVSQGGISYSFSDEDKKHFRLLAQSLLDEVGDNTSLLSDNYGWQGEDL